MNSETVPNSTTRHGSAASDHLLRDLAQVAIQVQADAQNLIGHELLLNEENIGYVRFGASSLLESVHNLMRSSLQPQSPGEPLLDREIRHDLRNKVAVVKGFSDLMRMDSPEDHQVSRVLDGIIERSRQFVEVLDNAKAEAQTPHTSGGELLAMAS